jgi:hypothetical protein
MPHHWEKIEALWCWQYWADRRWYQLTYHEGLDGQGRERLCITFDDQPDGLDALEKLARHEAARRGVSIRLVRFDLAQVVKNIPHPADPFGDKAA